MTAAMHHEIDRSGKPAPAASVLVNMSYRLDLVEKKTVDGAASCKTIIANLRELASAEDKHAKTYQKIQEALQAISYIKNANVASGLKNWHSAMLQNASETAAMKRRFASSLVSNVVLPLQDHVHNYRNQTRQVFFEMRSSYEVLVHKQNHVTATRERYIKACKAAEAAIRARNTAMDKLNDLELQAKKATPSSQLPPLALLEGKKNVQGLDGLNQRIKATLDESVTAKEVYIQSDMTCRSDRSRHQNLIADMLLKLETIEIQREEHLQNQVMFRVASMYQDMVTCVASSRKVLFDMSDPIFQAALESIAHFSDDFKAPDDVLTFITEQMTNDAETLAKLSDVFALMKSTFEAHAKRLQHITSSQSWALAELDGQLLAQAWENISSSVQIFAHIHEEYAAAVGGSITSVWKDLKAAQGHAKKQIAMMVQDIYLKRQGVQTNERDATQRFQRTKRELEAKQSQMDAVEREAAEEATSPDKDKGMSLVSLGWKDSAKIRLVKLKRVYQEYEETDMATAVKQMTFAKNATENFNVLFHTLVGTVHSDFINAQAQVVSGITKISTSWRTACSVTESSQLQVLRNVFGAIEAISPTSDLRLFVESQSSIHDPPNLKASTSLEFYTSDLIEMETRPPPPPSPAMPMESKGGSAPKTTTSAKLNWQHQVEFGLVLFYMFGLLALYFAMQTLRQELVHAQSVLHDQHGAVDSLEKMLREFE
ncbi:hypothetical protein H257_17562 [Aphanomyces astaci]|uniref:FCH domain-containing protein n=1 Tax=Aphanomyces astaci TaxID=112090 RepID=W4FEC5_APHAT|nr:hypothetical protein H257_17562 [Aphanomyces astaci]ETV65835.1 hypothetical protein H257_17562 [Aphanomyces astaci]|eukprot:XP_009844698.1 hypothetical protein H257_17562 [Aphanomyces astaci]